jgi:hypothetical protein
MMTLGRQKNRVRIRGKTGYEAKNGQMAVGAGNNIRSYEYHIFNYTKYIHSNTNLHTLKRFPLGPSQKLAQQVRIQQAPTMRSSKYQHTSLLLQTLEFRPQVPKCHANMRQAYTMWSGFYVSGLHSASQTDIDRDSHSPSLSLTWREFNYQSDPFLRNALLNANTPEETIFQTYIQNIYTDLLIHTKKSVRYSKMTSI